MDDRLIAVALGLLIGLAVAQIRVRNVREQAATDTLTGLYNRAWMDKTLGRLLAQAKRSKSPLSIMMIDLNHFKEANDRFGHQFGDQVLRVAAETMVGSLRGSDFIFRYGGDEFLVILPGAAETGALKAGKKILRLLDALSLATPTGRQFEDVGASIGIATYPTHAEVDQVLLKKADEAVYLAKDHHGHIEVAKL